MPRCLDNISSAQVQYADLFDRERVVTRVPRCSDPSSSSSLHPALRRFIPHLFSPCCPHSTEIKTRVGSTFTARFLTAAMRHQQRCRPPRLLSALESVHTTAAPVLPTLAVVLALVLTVLLLLPATTTTTGSAQHPFQTFWVLVCYQSLCCQHLCMPKC